jgi:DNA-binding PucR family transcriptional regulator
LPADAIADGVGELVCAIVPDPEGPGRRAQLQRAVIEADGQAGLGITVSWPQTAVSLTSARAALALADGGPAFIAARDHAGRLLLGSDPVLAEQLVRDRLAPLDDLTAGARARLTATLAAWLAEQGRLSPVAARLGVHPQTVRYRLGRLRDLFGEQLDDPDERYWLETAVRIAGG